MVTKTTVSFEASPAQFLEEALKAFVLESPDNCLKDIDGSPIFEEPVIGFANGDDPLFQDYKQIIGDFHLTPREVLGRHLRETSGMERPEINGLSVICWVLPLARKVRLANRKMTEGPSRHWNNAHFLAQDLGSKVARHVVSLLEERGHHAVAPDLTPYFEVRYSTNIASNWSHRHMAFAAGLGTFSLSDGFISLKGMAIRCKSVVTDLVLPPTLRRYASHVANCPFLVNGSCGECIQRCPAGAISAQGHDKYKCRDYSRVTLKHWLEKPGYIGKGEVSCGLCQTKVPCETMIPPLLREEKTPIGQTLSRKTRSLLARSSFTPQVSGVTRKEETLLNILPRGLDSPMTEPYDSME